MLKAAIVGCGKIADAHAAQMQRIPGCTIVAVCDREPLMARQLKERFPIGAFYSDLATMLKESHPDVVHITTPPEGHLSLAKMCLDAGCHVYVEKPFTLNVADARELITYADDRGLKVTAGHDDQFTHVSRRARALVQSGYLGSAPVHMESYYCYEMGDSGYAGALLGDKRHWIRRLPGKLLQNVISHGIARVAEYFTSESPDVMAYGFASGWLKSRGETELIDELRVIISEEGGATAYFTFSSQMRPSLHMFRMYGKKNGLILDHDQETLVRLRGARRKSYAEKFVPPLDFAKQYLGNLRTNLGLFFNNDFNMKSGMKYLIESFHQSIETGGPVPIPYREIVLTTQIMDSIFAQLDQNRAVALDRPTPVAAFSK